jgi:aspartyl-tRNA(Asn)/glutamyl-tRNA(Gln) amidotransferase subunit A
VTYPTSIAELAADPHALEALLADAAAANAAGHMYTQLLGLRALRSAATRDAPVPLPLWRVPLTIKDNIDLAGVDTSCGRRLPPQPAAASAAIVARLEALGAIIIGKTNLDEAALGATGRNPRFGRCLNPRFEARLSGGSSSGAAASIAAGHTRLGIGTDTLGSVRIPAAFCGVAGFKPSHGRLPTGGVAPLYPRFDTIGLLGRSLSDLQAAAAPLLTGRALPAARLAERPAPAVSITVLDEATLLEIEPGMAHAYRRCVRALHGTVGCRILAAGIDWATTAQAALWEVAHGFAVCSARSQPGYRAVDDLDGALLRLLMRARELPSGRLAAGRTVLAATAVRLRDCVQTAALLTPTCPQPAPLIDADVPRQVADFVAPANVAGLPAVCWAQNVGGAESLSLQLIGRFGDDLRLLDLAAAVQSRLDRVVAERAGAR